MGHIKLRNKTLKLKVLLPSKDKRNKCRVLPLASDARGNVNF